MNTGTEPRITGLTLDQCKARLAVVRSAEKTATAQKLAEAIDTAPRREWAGIVEACRREAHRLLQAIHRLHRQQLAIGPQSPGFDLHNRVRAGFLLQGTTLTEWCRKNGTHISNARGALLGTWNGPKGREMRARIVTAAQIDGLQGAAQ